YLHHVLPFHLITHYRYLFLFLFSLMTRRPPSSTLFPYMTLFRSVLSSDAGHELYKHRKATVEPVFAQNKFNRGFRRFQRRGRAEIGRHTSELQSQSNLVCRLLLEKKKKKKKNNNRKKREKIRENK